MAKRQQPPHRPIAAYIPTFGNEWDFRLPITQVLFESSGGGNFLSANPGPDERSRNKTFEALPPGLEVDVLIPFPSYRANPGGKLSIPGVIALVQSVEAGKGVKQGPKMTLQLDGEMIKYDLQEGLMTSNTLLELEELGFGVVPNEPAYRGRAVPRVLELERVSEGIVYPKDKTRQPAITVAVSIAQKPSKGAGPADDSSELNQASISVYMSKDPEGKEIIIVHYGKEPDLPKPDRAPGLGRLASKAYEPIEIFGSQGDDPPLPVSVESNGDEGGFRIEELEGDRRLGYRPPTTEVK